MSTARQRTAALHAEGDTVRISEFGLAADGDRRERVEQRTAHVASAPPPGLGTNEAASCSTAKSLCTLPIMSYIAEGASTG